MALVVRIKLNNWDCGPSGLSHRKPLIFEYNGKTINNYEPFGQQNDGHDISRKRLYQKVASCTP